ncbi:hypothetical protein BDR04DRAFT_1210613 [Suillus decipiens]|nr:hypothetical protein BDR04DRAFT_1210613 [Suillus decipiens]
MPLESGEAYKEVDMKKIWYPNWKGNIDDGVNAVFIQEVVNLVWDNEKVYFCNIHKQFLEHHNDDKARKAMEHKNQGWRHSHHQTVTKICWKAVEAFEKESGYPSVLAMIDTDFASDVLSYGLDTDLSEDMLKRQRDADVGKGTFIIEGAQWRSPDFVALGCWLSFKKWKVNKGPDEHINEGVPAPKHHKVVKKKAVKSTFDLAPSKMHSEPLISGKKTIPFQSMVSEKWLKKNPGTVLLDGGEWLSGFYGQLKEGDIHKDDAKFLKELDEWHKKDELSSDKDDMYSCCWPVHQQLVLAAKSKLGV